MERLYPKIVTLMGGISLGLTLTYLVGVVLAFLPAGEQWAEFFVPLALYLLIPPYTLLVSYLVARNHVGRFLLHRQAFDQAYEYAHPRVKSSPLRSRREVANHRLVCARALVGLGRYEEARKLLEGQHRRLPGPYATEARRWLLELALRRDDRKEAEGLVVAEPNQKSSARGELVAALACGAELAIRQGDQKAFRERMADALWHKSDHYRATLCRALAMIEYEEENAQTEELLQILDGVEARVVAEIPNRQAELTALRALVRYRRGDAAQAQRLLEMAQDQQSDQWSEQVLDEVASQLKVQTSTA